MRQPVPKMAKEPNGIPCRAELERAVHLRQELTSSVTHLLQQIQSARFQTLFRFQYIGVQILDKFRIYNTLILLVIPILRFSLSYLRTTTILFSQIREHHLGLEHLLKSLSNLHHGKLRRQISFMRHYASLIQRF